MVTIRLNENQNGQTLVEKLKITLTDLCPEKYKVENESIKYTFETETLSDYYISDGNVRKDNRYTRFKIFNNPEGDLSEMICFEVHEGNVCDFPIRCYQQAYDLNRDMYDYEEQAETLPDFGENFSHLLDFAAKAFVIATSKKPKDTPQEKKKEGPSELDKADVIY